MAIPTKKPTREQTMKPNIVFILVDNIGWGDFGVYGGTTATPRIDKMASEGIRSITTTSRRNARPRDPRS
jgi:arylsulfatase